MYTISFHIFGWWKDTELVWMGHILWRRQTCNIWIQCLCLTNAVKYWASKNETNMYTIFFSYIWLMERYRISLNGTCFTWTSPSLHENEQYLSSTPVWVQKTAQYRNCSLKSNEWYTTENELTACYSTSYVAFERSLWHCWSQDFAWKAAARHWHFRSTPAYGLIHTCLIEVKGLHFRELYLGFLISIVAFPKVPASVHRSTSSIHQSCSTSLSDIFLTRTVTLTILSYI